MYINNNIFYLNYFILLCDKGDFMLYFNGVYLIFVWFILRGNFLDIVIVCVGRRKCVECYVEFFNIVK